MNVEEKKIVKKVVALSWITTIIISILGYFIFSFLSSLEIFNFGMLMIFLAFLGVLIWIIDYNLFKIYLNYLKVKKIALSNEDEKKIRIKYWRKVIGFSLLIFLLICVVIASVGMALLETFINNLFTNAESFKENKEIYGLIYMGAAFAGAGAVIIYFLSIIYLLYISVINSLTQFFIVKKIKRTNK